MEVLALWVFYKVKSNVVCWLEFIVNTHWLSTHVYTQLCNKNEENQYWYQYLGFKKIEKFKQSPF